MRSRVKLFSARKRPVGPKTKIKKLPKRAKAVIWVSVVVLILYLLHVNIKPVVQTVSANQARILGTSVINNAVMNELSAGEAEYDRLVTIVYDSAGNIAAIESNASEMNKLKARIVEAVNESLATLPDQDVGIPLGTLTGIELLSGRGPKLKLKMTPSPYVESSLVNNFDSAGVNQTRHQILIEIKVTITAILVPYITTVDVSTTVIVAETIIVGKVPDMFAEFNRIT